MSLISRRPGSRKFIHWVKTFKSYSSGYFDEDDSVNVRSKVRNPNFANINGSYRGNDSTKNTISYDAAKIASKAKNPNSVVIRGDIFAINRDEDGNHVRITLKVRRESVMRTGDPYIRSEYFNVNFYWVSDGVKRWKMPTFYEIGDNVTTYSNLGRAARSDIMYLKGYAMAKHDRTAPDGITEENLNSADLYGETETGEKDEVAVDEMK